jgi:hypothetical protein
MRKTKANLVKIIESLEKTPIIEIACAKLKISRSTLYRWIESEPGFRIKVEEALDTGRSIVTDVAESHLISGVKEGEKGYVKYWLSNNCVRYKKNQVEEEPEEEDLTDEEKEDIANCMRAWSNPKISEDERDEDYEVPLDDPSRQ